jgi:uncharacterized protein (TIGR02001 family)
MKKTILLTVLGVITFLLATNINAQEEKEVTSPFSVGTDFYSTYVWRGVAFSGPSIQPYVDFTTGGLSIGSWGSYGFDGFMESDLYVSYGFDFGLSLGLTDYYYPGTPYFNYANDSTGAHGFEVNLGYEISGLSVSANYMINEAGMAGTVGGDMYFELGYGFENLDIFAGAGDGWHSSDGEFALVNVGVSTSKEIKFSDNFSLPVSGAAILNPDWEQFFIVIGFSF